MEIKSKEIKLVEVEALVPNPKNCNSHPKKQIERLAKIIKHQGFRAPITVSNRSGFIVAGHGRYEAAKMLGMEKLPVIYQDFETEADEYAHLVADNALQGWSELNISQIQLETLNMEGFDTDLLGFKSFVNVEVIPENNESSGGEPSMPKDTITKKGDIWHLGAHRLICGDATNVDDYRNLMGDEMAHLYLTDPPYNVAYTGKTKDSLTIQNDSMGNEDFRQFLYDSFVGAYSFMEPGAAFYIWHADLEGYNFRGAVADSGFLLKQNLIWVKQTLAMGRQDYQWKHEPCLYGWKPGTHKWYSDRKQTTVLEFNKPARNDIHPTMKPVELFSYQITNSTQRGEIVLDSFAGSGTSIISCQDTGRLCRAIELDEKYCDKILHRFLSYTGIKPFRIDEDGNKFEYDPK